MAFESLGGMHERAIVEGKKLAAALARHSGQEEGEASRHLFSRPSILLQKGNAVILLNRIPQYPSGIVDGDQELDKSVLYYNLCIIWMWSYIDWKPLSYVHSTPLSERKKTQ